MNEYHYVGHIFRSYLIFEGKVCMNDHFLVIDEYMRPPSVLIVPPGSVVRV